MGDNKADRNLYSPLNLPREWTGTMRNFGVQLVRVIEDIYNRLSKCIPYTKPASEKKALSAAQKSQARANIGLGGAATRGVANNLTTTSSSYVLDARQGKVLYDRFADAIAIISTGNTHVAITSGQYVYVKSHSTLTPGLYKATVNIAANATLTASNLTEVSDGIGGEVATIYDKVDHVDGTTVITDLDSIAYNSKGRIKLSTSLSPAGSSYQMYNYICVGSYNYRTLTVWNSSFPNQMWQKTRNNSTTWSDWYSIYDQIGNIQQNQFTCLKSGGKLRFSCSNTTGSMWMITAFRGAVGNDLGSWIAIMGSTSAITKNLCTIGANVSLAFDSTSNKLTLTNSDSTNDVYVSVIRLYGTGTLTATQA